MERDSDARAPREFGDGEVPFLEPELGAVEGLQVDGGEVRAAPNPRLLEAPHHVVAHRGLTLGGGLVHADPDHIAGDDGILDEVRVDVRGVWLDVHEHRLRPLIEDAIAGRNEAERGRDDFVPLANAEGADEQMRAARAAVPATACFLRA